jgi:hypothetical protein
MITITQDSELMTNYISANPIPAGNRFVAFRDENHDPAVISLGSDNTLNLVITVRGQPTAVDLVKTSGLFDDETKIQAFDVKQSPDLGLNICIVAEGAFGKSDFYLIHNIQPSELLKTISKDKVINAYGISQTKHIFMVRSKSSIQNVKMLMMVEQPLYQ